MSADKPIDVIIYHNPACGTSRNTLGLIRNAGIEPHVIEYLKTPPSRDLLKSLIPRMGVSVRDLVRVKGTPYQELKLDEPDVTDNQFLDAMMAHPILITGRSLSRLRASSSAVHPRQCSICCPRHSAANLAREDGELVVDSAGHWVS